MACANQLSQRPLRFQAAADAIAQRKGRVHRKRELPCNGKP
jgi:hypothetical protein